MIYLNVLFDEVIDMFDEGFGGIESWLFGNML